MMPYCLKRVPVTGALFCFTFLPLAGQTNTVLADCRLDRADEQVQVSHVHDGDTLWLTDGRRLRIIGINTPELARDDSPAEPLANTARDRLRQHLGRLARVKLRHGLEKTDRYGRLLAHVYTLDGQNISEWLLQEGLAYSLVVPPNLWQADCYQQAEHTARRIQKGLWSRQFYGVIAVDRLRREMRGFHIIRGRLQRLGESRQTLWLNFNRQFAVRILKKDLHWFKGMAFEKLIGKQLEVRGWLQYHKHQLRMRVKHPAAIQILP